MIKKIMGALRNPVRIVQFCSRRGWLDWMDDESYLKLVFKARLGKRLDLENPSSFNEKLQWLKLYDRKPEYTRLVDKYEVRDYIAKEIGNQYLIPLVGGPWDRSEDIDFNALPDQFVLKCTHDSGSVIVCRDKEKFDRAAAKKKLSQCLKNNGYNFGREWPYKDVKPRIVAERYMEDSVHKELRDYKFFCFDGQVKCYKIDYDRFVKHRANYYDTDMKLLPFGEVTCPPDFQRQLQQPKNLKQMLSLAECLSKGYPFVRVDFYEVNDRIYFGELTFYPASGFGKFTPESWDDTLGDWITLSQT